MSCKGVKLNHLALRHKEHVHCTDNESISITKASYLISLCSSYLSLRQSNHQMIKLYYLHRFSKQFGYPQNLSGGLPKIFRIGTLEAVYQHWESCTSLGTYSKVTIPDYHSLEEFSITKAIRIGGSECVILIRKFLLLLVWSPLLILLGKYPQNL